MVLANPTFGGSDRVEVKEHFPIRTSETAYLFLRHFIKILRVGGRCGIVIKSIFLRNTDNAAWLTNTPGYFLKSFLFIDVINKCFVKNAGHSGHLGHGVL